MKAKDLFKKHAKGNIDADLKVISLGVGVQSTALYLMSSMGYKVPSADVAIFADTGGEYKETLQLLKWLLDWKDKNNGIPIYVNREKNLLKDLLKSAKDGTRCASIPVFSQSGGMIMRQCTQDYKILPVIKTTRMLHKLKPRQRMKPTEMWLGISTDEIERMKESRLYNIKYFYPLIYHRMSRKDCLDFFKNNNFPTPIKSGCVFCPYHNNKDWGKQKWRTSSGKPSKGKRRYLPDAAWKALSASEKAATNRAKAKGNRQGKQFVKQPKKIEKKTRAYR